MILENFDAIGINKELFYKDNKIKTIYYHEFIFFPTLYCNFKCYYCFNLKDHPKVNTINENFYNDMMKNLEKLKNSYFPVKITMLGGEFFTHPKVLEILKLLSEIQDSNPENIIFLVTNGSLIPKFINKIDKRFVIEVSYHPSEISDNSFNKIIKLLDDNNFENLIHFVFDENYSERIFKMFEKTPKHKRIYGYKDGSELQAYKVLNKDEILDHVKIKNSEIFEIKEYDYFKINVKNCFCHMNNFIYLKDNIVLQSCSNKKFTVDELVDLKIPPKILCRKTFCSQFENGICQFTGNKFNPKIYRNVEILRSKNEL